MAGSPRRFSIPQCSASTHRRALSIPGGSRAFPDAARSLLLGACLSLWATAPAHAQNLGTFRWQLQPYCNVVTMHIVGVAGVYTLEGYDDQCGAPTRAPLTGVATPNPDGTIGFGLNVVTTPGGRGVQIDARILLPAMNGPWTDSQGNTGTFVLTPAGGTGGSPRPVAAKIGAAAVDSSQVQLRVAEPCSNGRVIQRVHGDGRVTCVPGLTQTDGGAANLSHTNGLVINSPPWTTTPIPAEGPGRRMMWHAGKAALRAGEAIGTEWDDANIGLWSTAFGTNVTASGTTSFAAGSNAYAFGSSAVALGFNVAAVGTGSVAVGSNARSDAGAFTFADRSVSAVLASGPNQFNARAAGGVGFYTSTNLTAGVELKPGASAWSSVSDVTRKENFRNLDGDAVLAELARMPIREWNYKAQDAAIRHVGPTAQDFHAAFGLGEDPLRISTIDADGIALAAIQALEARTKMYEARIAALEQQLAALRATTGGGR